MPRGYWIARIDVTDQDGYTAYIQANAEAFTKFGARFVVRGGGFQAVEGHSRARNIVLEFPDYATALTCYHSPEYQRALALRSNAATADLIIIEGYDGPQPGYGN